MENDPNIDPSYYEFDVIRVEAYRGTHGTGRKLYIVENKRDYPDYKWLIGATVTLDGEQFICTEVEANQQWNPFRVGEEIGLLVKAID